MNYEQEQEYYKTELNSWEHEQLSQYAMEMFDGISYPDKTALQKSELRKEFSIFLSEGNLRSIKVAKEQMSVSIIYMQEHLLEKHCE